MFNKIKEIIRYRELLRNLVYRDLADRYKRSYFGFLWAILEPLGLMIIYLVVFSVIVKLKIPNYPVFLLCGILPWIYLSKSVIHSADSIIKDQRLVKKIYFPREVLPISSVLARLVNFLLSLGIFMIFLIVLGYFSWAVLLLFMVLSVQTFLLIGTSLIISSLNVYFQDIELLLEFIVPLWFYATPVFYPLSMVPEKIMFVYILNPAVGIISSYRSILLEGCITCPQAFLSSAVMSLVIFVAGFWIFGRLNRRIGELL